MQTIACCVLNGKFSSVVGGMAGENNSTECVFQNVSPKHSEHLEHLKHLKHPFLFRFWTKNRPFFWSKSEVKTFIVFRVKHHIYYIQYAKNSGAKIGDLRSDGNVKKGC